MEKLKEKNFIFSMMVVFKVNIISNLDKNKKNKLTISKMVIFKVNRNIEMGY